MNINELELAEQAIMRIYSNLKLRTGEGLFKPVFMNFWPPDVRRELFQDAMNSLISKGLVEVGEQKPGFFCVSRSGFMALNELTNY